jgi:hypothetical protein
MLRFVNLAEWQRSVRARHGAETRKDLRGFLLENRTPSPAIFVLVSRRLYAEGAIDNLGLAAHWVATATVAERAALFSAIATALLLKVAQ